MKSNKNNIKLGIIFLFFVYLVWSSYKLMAIPEEQSTQTGFALFYFSCLLIAIYRRIYSIKVFKEQNLDISTKMYENFKFIITTLLTIFGLYSTYLFILADIQVTSHFFSSIWLLLLIFSFQSIPFLILAYQFKIGISSKSIARTFFFSYSFLSLIFGWLSAAIAQKILMLPAQQDLFLISYGTLVLPILFVIYFDKNFNYLPVF